MSQPSPEAMRAAERLISELNLPFTIRVVTNTGWPVTSVNSAAYIASLIDAEFRPLIESHERLRVALQEAIRYSPYRGESEETEFLRQARAALAQVPADSRRDHGPTESEWDQAIG